MNAPLPPEDDFLDDDSDLRALYGKLPAAEPPAALDARIRAQAHAAAQGDQRVRNKTRRVHPGWAIAASVLLASGLILMTDLSQQADKAGQASAPDIDAELAQPPQLKEMAPAAAPVPPAELRSSPQPRPAPQAELRMERGAEPPPPPAPEAAPSVPRPAPKPGADITPDAVAPRMRQLAPPSLAPAQPAAPAPAPAPARQAESYAPMADAPMASGSSAAGATHEPDTARAQAMQKAQAENAQRAEAVQEERKTTRTLAPRKVAATAEQQVERVRAMLKAGKHEDAMQALQALRQAWPEYEIPQDLRGLQPSSAPR